MHDFVIETKHLTKIYGEQTVLEKVSLHVERGKIYVRIQHIRQKNESKV